MRRHVGHSSAILAISELSSTFDIILFTKSFLQSKSGYMDICYTVCIFMGCGYTVSNILIATEIRYIDKHMPGKTKSTIMIDTDLWKRLKVISVLNEFEISELVEEALREKLARMQQPEQYAEYKDVESLRYKPSTTPQRQLHQPATPGGDSGALPQLSPTITAPSTTEQQSLPKVLQIDILLPGIEFPADRSEIIKRAEKAGTPTVVNFLRSISDREYRNKSALENELSVRAKSSKSDFIRKGGNVIFKIDDKKLRVEQYDERRLEQENKLNELMGKIRIK
jgi:hypothetical protein